MGEGGEKRPASSVQGKSGEAGRGTGEAGSGRVGEWERGGNGERREAGDGRQKHEGTKNHEGHEKRRKTGERDTCVNFDDTSARQGCSFFEGKECVSICNVRICAGKRDRDGRWHAGCIRLRTVGWGLRNPWAFFLHFQIRNRTGGVQCDTAGFCF